MLNNTHSSKQYHDELLPNNRSYILNDQHSRSNTVRVTKIVG